MGRIIAALFLIILLFMIGLWSMYSPLPDEMARVALGEERRIQRQGRSIAYYLRGSGPRIVLAASAGREASDFNELTDALVGAGFRTVSVEAPGIGGSELPEGTFDLYDLADDIHAVIARDIEESGATGSVLLGHAFGNRAVRATATKYPDGVLGVVLVAAGGLHPIEEKAAEALRNCFDPRRTSAQRLEDIRYGFFADGNDIPDYWRRGWHRHTAMLQVQANSAIESAQWWGAGGARMLVVQADSDKIAPRKDTADLLAQEFGERVEVAVIKNAGHALLPESPDEVARVIVDFLNELK